MDFAWFPKTLERFKCPSIDLVLDHPCSWDFDRITSTLLKPLEPRHKDLGVDQNRIPLTTPVEINAVTENVPWILYYQYDQLR